MAASDIPPERRRMYIQAEFGDADGEPLIEVSGAFDPFVPGHDDGGQFGGGVIIPAGEERTGTLFVRWKWVDSEAEPWTWSKSFDEP